MTTYGSLGCNLVTIDIEKVGALVAKKTVNSTCCKENSGFSRGWAGTEQGAGKAEELEKGGGWRCWGHTGGSAAGVVWMHLILLCGWAGRLMDILKALFANISNHDVATAVSSGRLSVCNVCSSPNQSVTL